MCGRVALASRDAVKTCAGVERELTRPTPLERDGDWARAGGRNASPGCAIAAVRIAAVEADDDGASARLARATVGDRRACAIEDVVWGVRFDSRRGGNFERSFNARVEGLLGGDESTFAAKLAKTVNGRCVVYVDGFYEWREEGPKGAKTRVKQPYMVRRADGKPLALASVLTPEKARSDAVDDFPRREAAVITMPSAGGELAWLHDRQPLFLWNDRDFDEWLFGDWARLARERRAKDVKGLLQWHPVTTKINHAAYDGEDASAPVKRAVEKDAGSVAALFAAATKKRKVDDETAVQID